MPANSDIQCIGLCGAGQMGAAAAVAYKRAGYEVLLWDRDAATLSALSGRLEELEVWLDAHAGPAKVEGGRYETARGTGDIDANADLVMDCIAEDFAQKAALFQGLPGAIGRGSLFITTTSGLSITRLGEESGTGPLLAGTHFWNPPHLMPLVEVVRGRDTPDGVMDRVCAVIESIGKIPVRVNRDVPGFIGNRLLHALWREAIYLVQEGIAAPEDVDRVARLTFGLRMPAVGPLENMDVVGLDLIETIHEYLLADLSNDTTPLAGLRERVQRGDLGLKSGTGFYDWHKRDGKALIDRRDRQIVRHLAYLRETETP